MTPMWKKSSRSYTNQACVEVAGTVGPDGPVGVRDSKLDTAGDFPVVRTAGREWAAFVAGIKSGGFDR